ERLDQDLGVWRTQRSGKRVAMATALSLQIDGHDIPATTVDQLKWSWSWKARAGQIVCFERTVAVARSDALGLVPRTGARHKLEVAHHLGWRGVLADQKRPGQPAGGAATSRSAAMLPRSMHCASP